MQRKPMQRRGEYVNPGVLQRQISGPGGADVSFERLPYQLSMVGSVPTLVNQGSIPEKEPEKQLPHSRRAAGVDMTRS